MTLSARKRKAQINKQFLQRVKKHNEETLMSVDQLGDELFNSFVEGAAEEIKKSPHLTSIAEKFSDIVVEFFNGVREGIDSELANIRAVSDAVNLSKAVIESSASGNEELLDALKDLKGELEGTNNELKGFNNTLKEQIKEAKEAARQATGDITSASREYIKPKYGMAGKVGRFAVSMLDGIPGLEKFGLGSKYLEKYDERESWIRNQQKLDPSLSRKELKKNYKVVQQSITELKELENEKEILRRQGYSDEQIEKIGGYESKIQEKLKNIIPFDKRFEKYEKALRTTISEKELRTATKGSDLTTSEETSLEDLETQKKQLDEQEKQSKLLEEIAALLRKPFQAGADKNDKEQKEGGGLLDNLPGLDIDIIGKKSPGRILKGAKGLLGAGARFLGRNPGAILKGGGALAVAGGLYEGYSTFNEAADKQQQSISDIESKVKEGLITKEEAEKQKEAVNQEAIENKSGAVGKGIGAAAGGLAGMKAGALLGSMFGPIGTVVGGLAGGVIGSISGSSVGQNIGGFVGKGINFLTGKTETENKEQIIDPSTGNLVNKKEISVSEKVYNNTQKEEITIKEMGKEIGANIKVNVPPVVIPPQQEKVVPTPFSQIMKNNEPSISSYIRSRYAY